MREITPLLKGQIYHVFNRGTNKGDVFFEERNYFFFLDRWEKYISPIAHTYAYCLLRNHFHALIKLKAEDAFGKAKNGELYLLDPAKQFSHSFNSYTQAINTAYDRSGSLWEHPFRRKEVDDDNYFAALVAYIHFNPEKHHFTKDFKNYPYSSYNYLISNKSPVTLDKEVVINFFGSSERYVQFHGQYRDFSNIKKFVGEEDW